MVFFLLFFSFLLVSHTFTLSDPNRNALLIFFSRCHLMLSSKTVIVKWIFIWMLFFHEMYILYYTFGSTAAIWQAKQKLLHTNETWNGWRKKCCKWCGFGLLFVLDPIAKISFFLFVYGRWVGFWHSRYRRTHIIFFGIKRKAISSMWSETFGFIHRMHGIFTIRWACACVFFCRYFCLLAPISFFFSFTKSTVHGNVRNVLACDNGLCESNMINL